jgi:hypothetical protein
MVLSSGLKVIPFVLLFIYLDCTLYIMYLGWITHFFKTRPLKLVHAWPEPPVLFCTLSTYAYCCDNARASSACEKGILDGNQLLRLSG